MGYPAGWPFWMWLSELGVPILYKTRILQGIDGTEFYICPALGVSVERCNGESEDAVYQRLFKEMDQRYFALTGDYFDDE